ncbi:MAG: prephenate dehydrogenase [Planctomycetota bacterium]
MFENVAIIGPGLIGGSIGMALRRQGLARTVVGIGRRRESLDKAHEVGAIDRATLDPQAGVAAADLVVLATPIGTFAELMAQVAPALKPEALLIDVASSKVKVVEVISSALRQRPDVAYIPTHPMAGSEQRGPAAADPDLFEGAICIVTPLPNTFPDTKSQVTHMWQALGATVVSMTPQAHDRAVARISHVPHLAAAALMALVHSPQMRLCGKGLLDTTRVASGDPDLWMDICKSNREDIREALVEYVNLLQEMAEGLAHGNLARLRTILKEAKERRDGLVESHRAVQRLRQR